jgi:hypothetical protein
MCRAVTRLVSLTSTEYNEANRKYYKHKCWDKLGS